MTARKKAGCPLCSKQQVQILELRRQLSATLDLLTAEKEKWRDAPDTDLLRLLVKRSFGELNSLIRLKELLEDKP